MRPRLLKEYRRFGKQNFILIQGRVHPRWAETLKDRYKAYNKVRIIKLKDKTKSLYVKGGVSGAKIETTRGWVYNDQKSR